MSDPLLIYVSHPGNAPLKTDLNDIPERWSREIKAWLHQHGYRAVWFMLDEGIETGRKVAACCYGSKGE